MNCLKISIIMPNYNGEKYLEKAIQSFIIQDYENKELIIVDGKSTDKSHNIINKYCDNKTIKHITNKDKGISDAINIGISYADGDIIGYMGSDDILYKNIFNEISYHSNIINYDAIYFNSYTYEPKRNKCQLRKCPYIEFNKTNLLKKGTLVGLQNIFFTKKIFDKYKYNINNKYSMDYELYFNLVKENFLFLYVDKVATINIFDGNITGSLTKKQTKEALKVALDNSSTLKEIVIVLGKYIKFIIRFKGCI